MRSALNLKSRYLRVCLFFFASPTPHPAQLFEASVFASVNPFTLFVWQSGLLLFQPYFIPCPSGFVRCRWGGPWLSSFPGLCSFSSSLLECFPSPLHHSSAVSSAASERCLQTMELRKICHDSLVSQLMSPRAFCTLWSLIGVYVPHESARIIKMEVMPLLTPFHILSP